MKITAVTSEVLRIPIRHPGSLGVGKLDEIENVLVRIRTDAGVTGLGESSPWPVFAENCWSVKAALEHYLGPCLIGETPFDIERLLLKMDATLADTPFAKAALDMALHDLVGKALDQPVYNLLGGLVNDRITMSYSIANQDVDKDVREVEWLLDRGVRVFKVKTGVVAPAVDRARARAIRQVIGPEGDLRLDYNQSIKPEQAIQILRELEEFRPTFIEQPTRRWDLDGLARITAAIDTPIMADEAVFSPADAMRVARERAADMISIKLMKPGGIVRARRIANIAEAAGMPCYAGAMWESGVGIAASLHFMAATPNVTYGSDFYIPYFLMQRDIVKDRPLFEGGYVHVPRGPGFGVELDEDAVRQFRVG
jgi:muconate cycloisomerase